MKYILFAVMMFLALPAAQAAEDLMGIYQGYAADTQLPLDQPHRSHGELSGWVSDVIADSLTFVPGQTNRKLADIKPRFTEAGFKAYLTFLGQLGFAEDVRQQSLKLGAIVNHEPSLVGQGASGGRYAWAFDVPIVMSTGDRDSTRQVTKTLNLIIQIGRSTDAPEPNGVFIENWTVKTTPQDNGGQKADTP